jgi:hypothetical protein
VRAPTSEVEVANGLHESIVAMEDGRWGDEACCESWSRMELAAAPMFSVPFVQKVCFFASMMVCFMPISKFLIAVSEICGPFMFRKTQARVSVCLSRKHRQVQ